MSERKITRIDFFRHGETAFHGTNRVAGGIVDVPLNQTGVDQAIALDRRTRNITLTAVHSSPLQRAVDTARPLAVARGIDVVIVPELRERRFGRAIEELTDNAQLEAVRADLEDFWHLPPDERMNMQLTRDMETDRELLHRVRGYLKKQPLGATIGAATHWDVISTLTLHETGKLISPLNTTGVTLDVDGNAITIVDMQGNEPILHHSV